MVELEALREQIRELRRAPLKVNARLRCDEIDGEQVYWIDKFEYENAEAYGIEHIVIDNLKVVD